MSAIINRQTWTVSLSGSEMATIQADRGGEAQLRLVDRDRADPIKLSRSFVDAFAAARRSARPLSEPPLPLVVEPLIALMNDALRFAEGE